MNDIDSIVQWFNADVPVAVREDLVLAGFHSSHPRILFLKGLPPGAIVLDVGAGDGSMQLFRTWLTPARTDLKMYAYSLEKGIHFDSYDGFEIGNWDERPPLFEGLEFDAMFSAHFIEHIQDPSAYFEWAGSRLAPGGRIFTEWPSERALRAPTKSELHLHGIDLFLGNFYDDLTHRSFPSKMRVLRALRKAGLEVEAAGTIRLPLYETQMLGHYRRTGDTPTLQLAYWSRTGWCQYVIAQKVDPREEQPESGEQRRRSQNPEPGALIARESLEPPRQDHDALDQAQTPSPEEFQRQARLEQHYEALQMRYSQLFEEHSVLQRQVAMASRSRWCALGRIFGVGPRFD